MDAANHPTLYLTVALLRCGCLLIAMSSYLYAIEPALQRREATVVGGKHLPLVAILRVVVCCLVCCLAWNIYVFTWIGLVVPGTALLLVCSRQLKRQRYTARLLAVLPHAVDLLAVTLATGHSLAAALQRLAALPACEPLASELRQALLETRAGKPLNEALEAIQRRCTLAELRLTINTMQTGHRTGGGIASALAQLAERFTEERLRRAEAAANRTPVKLMAPLFICIFPATFLLLFFPLLYRIMRMF